jgi:hypothetical protein
MKISQQISRMCRFKKNVIDGPQDVLLFQVNENKLVVCGANGLNIQQKLSGCQISIYN